MPLAGRAIVVTGASGIAAAGARRFAAEGAAIFVISLDESECTALADEIVAQGGRAGWCKADLRDEGETKRAFDAARAELGRIDGAFLVAGGSGRRFGDGPIDQVDADAWRETIELNLSTTALSVAETVRIMLHQEPTGGSVVLVSSAIARHPSPRHFGTHAYAAAKGAQLTLVTALAATYAARSITFNAIAPGLVDTPMAARAASDPEIMSYARSKQPLARGMLDPTDVAAAAGFLLSADARMITGQVLAVDGGWGVTEAGAG
jgi:NAD(P)-dependent dehydrogenase (short-subunit alcohol dehydrogenase family)